MVIDFEPVSNSDACVLCKKGHAVWKCELLQDLSAADLGVREGERKYMHKMPRMFDTPPGVSG